MNDYIESRTIQRICVDKTRQIYELLNQENLCRICRPHGFGKTHLLGTIKTLFTEGVSAFEKYEIGDLWTEKTRDVAFFPFREILPGDGEGFEKSFYRMVESRLAHLGFSMDWASTVNPALQFGSWLMSRPTNSLVLLIDDFDYPLVSALEEPERLDEIQKVLQTFYRQVLSEEGKLRFALLAGTFNLLGEKMTEIDFGRFYDMTYVHYYADLLGYTQAELEKYFPDRFEFVSKNLVRYKKNSSGSSKLVESFCFDFKNDVRVFPPVAFHRTGYDAASCTTAKASDPGVAILKHLHKIGAINVNDLMMRTQRTVVSDLWELQWTDKLNPLPNLVQAGIFTIDEVDPYEQVTLAYPQESVRSQLIKFDERATLS